MQGVKKKKKERKKLGPFVVVYYTLELQIAHGCLVCLVMHEETL